MINPNEPVIVISIGCPSLAARRRFDELLARAQEEREAAAQAETAEIEPEMEAAESYAL